LYLGSFPYDLSGAPNGKGYRKQLYILLVPKWPPLYGVAKEN